MLASTRILDPWWKVEAGFAEGLLCCHSGGSEATQESVSLSITQTSDLGPLAASLACSPFVNGRIEGGFRRGADSEESFREGRRSLGLLVLTLGFEFT